MKLNPENQSKSFSVLNFDAVTPAQVEIMKQRGRALHSKTIVDAFTWFVRKTLRFVTRLNIPSSGQRRYGDLLR